MRESVTLGGGRVQFEASGGVNLDTVAAIATTGVDWISSARLTHSARLSIFRSIWSAPNSSSFSATAFS